MRLSSSALTDLVRRSAGEPEAAAPTRDQLVEAARRGRLLPTLVSAWLADREPVAPSLVDELDVCRARERRYRHVTDLIRAEVGSGFRVRKGWEIAKLLPVGWFRASRDLDLEVPDLVHLSTAAGVLVGHGWTVTRLAAFQDNGTLHLAADLTDRRHGAHPDGYDLVQMQTCVHVGPAWSAPPVGRCPLISRMTAPARSLVDVLAATTRRVPTARDVLDRATLWTVRDEALDVAVVRLELVPEWRALSSLVARSWPGIEDAGHLAAASEKRAVDTVRRRWRRLRETGSRTPAEAFRLGRVVSGVPSSGPRDRPVSVEIRGDDVVFDGPLGCGVLTVQVPRHIERMGWARD